LKNSSAVRLARELKAWRLRLAGEPNVAGRRRKNEETENKLERAHRPDYHFAVVSVALMVFMVVAGFGAWMFGSRAANLDPPARSSGRRS
jgi:hypothetical protein